MRFRCFLYFMIGLQILFGGIHLSYGNEGKAVGARKTKEQAARRSQGDREIGHSVFAKAGESLIFTVSKDDTISAQIEDQFLADLLRVMVEKRFVEIRGPMPSSDPITVAFSHVTLGEALEKMMRGYNYVLMERGTTEIPLLVVMGKAERSKATDQRPVGMESASKGGSDASESRRSHTPRIVAEERFAPVATAVPHVSISRSSSVQQDVMQEDVVAPGVYGGVAGGGKGPEGDGPTSTTQQTVVVPGTEGDPDYKPGGPGFVSLAAQKPPDL